MGKENGKLKMKILHPDVKLDISDETTLDKISTFYIDTEYNNNSSLYFINEIEEYTEDDVNEIRKLIQYLYYCRW